MHDLPSLPRAERRVDLLEEVEKHFDEIRFFRVIEADSASASFFPERYIRPLGIPRPTHSSSLQCLRGRGTFTALRAVCSGDSVSR